MYKISAIVCTYQHMDFLPKSLQALTEQSLHAQDYEIIIINNNSVDGTEEYCLNFIDTHLDHHITYYKETNQGLSYARNTGIKLSWGHIVCFIDDDAISDRNLLKEYITFFGSHPLASAAAGRVYPIFETKRPQWMLSFFLDLTSSLDLGDKMKLFPNKKYPVGANIAIKRNYLNLNDLFEVNLGKKGDNTETGEVKDFFGRIQQSGSLIYYLPTAIVQHYVSAQQLTDTFLKQSATALGHSERLRTKNLSPKVYRRRIITEIFLFTGSLFLCLWYTIRFQPQIGLKLLKCHWYICRALLGF